MTQVTANKRERMTTGRGCNRSCTRRVSGPSGRRIVCALHPGQQSKVTDPANLPRHHLRRPSTDMDSRNAFLKPFKKLKHRLTRGSRKRDGGSGSESNREGRDTGLDGNETSRSNSNLHPEVEDAVEIGPGREGNDGGGRKVEQADPPTSTSSISYDREPESK